ncbi:camphor resistance protein CrcB [Listeria monocytogenes]|nr:camphor resistance protein CrcB [Listeria monocytogenes]
MRCYDMEFLYWSKVNGKQTFLLRLFLLILLVHFY